jgi:hypothetical protein
MPLHPFKSRKKRLENALTVFALGLVLLAMFLFMSFDGKRFRWEEIVPYAVGMAFGLFSLAIYVRWSDAE